MSEQHSEEQIIEAFRVFDTVSEETLVLFCFFVHLRVPLISMILNYTVEGRDRTCSASRLRDYLLLTSTEIFLKSFLYFLEDIPVRYASENGFPCFCICLIIQYVA
jgi:hypothetical protein